MSNLSSIISHIETRLSEVEQAFATEEAAAGYLSYERFRQREAAYREIVHSLTETHSARVREGEPASLALAGIRTSCTQGPRGLLSNWLGRARKQVEAEKAGAR